MEALEIIVNLCSVDNIKLNAPVTILRESGVVYKHTGVWVAPEMLLRDGDDGLRVGQIKTRLYDSLGLGTADLEEGVDIASSHLALFLPEKIATFKEVEGTPQLRAFRGIVVLIRRSWRHCFCDWGKEKKTVR